MNRRTANADPTPKRLSSTLDAYFLSAAFSRAPDWKHKLVCWRVYAAAAGSTLALTTSASAAIIYSGPQNLTDAANPVRSYPSVWDLRYLNLDIDGRGNSFRLVEATVRSVGSGNIPGGGGQVLLSANGGARQVLRTGLDLRRLASGEVISVGEAGFAGTHGVLRLRLGTTYGGQIRDGKWPDGNNTGFAGIQFTEGGLTHVGWIRLRFSEDANSNPDSITAIDWAYNDVPGASIRAGETSQPSSVPEPSNGALAMLAAGAGALLAWRKHRHAA